MVTKTKSRIRWTAEEIDIVVNAARELQAKGAKLTSERRVAKAQVSLPKNRRRPYSANLGSWLSKAVRGVAGPDATSGPANAVQAVKKGAGTLAAEPPTALLTQALIATGVAVLKGILADPGVQKALKQALR